MSARRSCLDLPALDGLRGVAVRVGGRVPPGADGRTGRFLGVDMFFVLSGFLITSLIVTEAERRGSDVDVPAFYLRRARRLLPALLLLLLAGAVYAATWAPTAELDRLRSHSLWTLGYLANWRFIADGTTYTDAIYGQSPLRHTWSLAIEEQFYIAFPLLVLALGSAGRLAGLGLATPGRRRGRDRGCAGERRVDGPALGRRLGSVPRATSAQTPASTRC